MERVFFGRKRETCRAVRWKKRREKKEEKWKNLRSCFWVGGGGQPFMSGKNNRVTKKVLMKATKKKFIFLPFQLKVKLMVISSDMCLDT